MHIHCISMGHRQSSNESKTKAVRSILLILFQLMRRLKFCNIVAKKSSFEVVYRCTNGAVAELFVGPGFSGRNRA